MKKLKSQKVKKKSQKSHEKIKKIKKSRKKSKSHEKKVKSHKSKCHRLNQKNFRTHILKRFIPRYDCFLAQPIYSYSKVINLPIWCDPE